MSSPSRRSTMPDRDITRLLDRAGLSYSPDTSKGLANVKARVARRKRARRTASAVFLVVLAAVFVIIALTVPGQHSANAVRYLRISPAVRVVDLGAPPT